MSIERRLAELEREVQRLRGELARVPVRIGMPAGGSGGGGRIRLVMVMEEVEFPEDGGQVAYYCEIYSVEPATEEGDAPALVNTGDTLYAFNFSNSIIIENTYYLAHRVLGGAWMIENHNFLV